MDSRGINGSDPNQLIRFPKEVEKKAIEGQQESISLESNILEAQADATQDSIEDYQARGFESNRQGDPGRTGRRSLKERLKDLNKFKGEASQQKPQKITNVEFIKRLGDRQRNRFEDPELSRRLLAIFDKLKPGMTQSELKALLSEDGILDPAVELEIIEFLLECTDGELRQALMKLKNESQSGRAAIAEKNIAAQTKAYSDQGLGSQQSLRKLYIEVTTGGRDTHALFDELLQKYEYDQMKTAIEFLLHSLGADINSSGSSMEKGHLHKFLSEVRSLQAILGVYYFFQKRHPMVQKLAEKAGEPIPTTLPFTELARSFLMFTASRYPSSQKMLQQAVQFKIETVPVKILIFSQYRDCMRHISPRLFYSPEHREDCWLSILEGLEELEKLLDEMEWIEEDANLQEEMFSPNQNDDHLFKQLHDDDPDDMFFHPNIHG